MMIGVSWYVVAVNGDAPGGDMIGHAATAEWLRTLPWWDWRGWSDWFYGGQAIGVNYPPLGHYWMRFTHPVHGQMAAVTIGLLVLLPWGTLRLARAVGYSPHSQRAAVAAMLILTAVSGHMHWVLSGFHATQTFFGSWPAMLGTVIGMFAAAHAARCQRPIAAGVVLGVAGLVNATVIPGVAVVCMALLISSGASFERALRWCATSGSAAVAISAWWLVPFAAGLDRLVPWDVALSAALFAGGVWQAAVLAVVGATAAWAARSGTAPSRHLALAALAGLGATLLGDLFGYLRPERWLELPILVAVLAAAGLAPTRRPLGIPPVRPAWAVLACAFLIVFGVVTLRLEVLPLAVWLMLRPQRVWAWGGALAWTAVLLLAPLVSSIRSPAPPEPLPTTPLEAAAASANPHGEGLVYTDGLFNTAAGDVDRCPWGFPWSTTVKTQGRIRPLFGLYRETSSAAEFLDAETLLRGGYWTDSGASRPHWLTAWQALGKPSLEGQNAATSLGARWYARCDSDGNAFVMNLPGVLVEGVAVVSHAHQEAWHEAAAEWWVSLASGSSTDATSRPVQIPILRTQDVHDGPYPSAQAASGLSLHAAQDRLALVTETPGWAWIRVPWDPDWRTESGAPVYKGGPGHLVVWAERGTTELRWKVPKAVDTAAVGATAIALLSTAALSVVNRRRGWHSNPDRSRPAAHALAVFADTVDEWVHSAVRNVRRVVGRSH